MKLLRRLVLVSLAFSISFCGPCNVSQANYIRKVISNRAIGRPEIRIAFHPKGAIYVSSTFDFNKKNPKLRFNGKLLKINDQFLKGKTKKEIQNLLKGPVYSDVKITYLDEDFNSQDIVLKRVPLSLKKIQEGSIYKDIKHFSRYLSRETNICFPTDYFRFGIDKKDANLDLLARISAKSCIETAKLVPAPNDAIICYHAADATMLSDTIGDIDLGDRYLTIVIKNPKFTKRHLESEFRKQFLEHLFVTGRHEEFKLISSIFERDLGRKDIDSSDDESLNRPNFLKIQLEFYLNRNREKATQIALAMTKEKDLDVGNFSKPNIEWLGDTLENFGLNKEALSCYQKLSPLKLLKRQLDSYRPMRLTNLFDYEILRIAQLQNKIGKTEEGIKTLEKLLRLHNQIPAQIESKIESLPMYFPTRSDIETQLALLLYKHGDIKEARELAKVALNRIKKANVDSKQLEVLKVLSQADNRETRDSLAEKSNYRIIMSSGDEPDKTDELYSLIRTALRAIDEKNNLQADDCVKKLTQIYREDSYDKQYTHQPINLLCSLLNISRKFADSGEYKRSNRLLDFLEDYLEKEATPQAYCFLLLEKTFNAVTETGDKTHWKKLDAESPLKDRTQVLFKNCTNKSQRELVLPIVAFENARSLGQICYSAGFLNRSRALIEHALDLSADIKSLELESNKIVQQEKTLLFLDAAILNAKLGDVKKANNFFRKAQKLRKAMDSNSQFDYFIGEYNYKCAELGNCFHTAGKTLLAIKILKQVLPFLDSSVNEDFSPGDAQTRSKVHEFLASQAAIRSQLAQLFFELEDYKEANRYIVLALHDLRHDSAPLFVWALAAEIAVANQDYDAATHSYSEAEKVVDYPLQVSEIQSSLNEKLLEKAYKYLEKAMGINDVERANIYLRLGRLNKENNPKKALTLYQKAYKIVPDLEVKKSELAQQIAKLERKVSLHRKNGRSKKQVKEILLDSEIDAYRQAAVLAEKNKRLDAFKLWLNLAKKQANAHYPNEAIKNAKHGLSLYKRLRDYAHLNIPIHGYYGLVATLIEQGFTNEAEELLRESCEVVNAKYGARSPNAAAQLAQLYLFYLKTNQYEQSTSILDKILAFKPRVIEVGGYSSALSTIHSANNPPICKNNEFAKKAFLKVLASQKSSLPDTDIRIANTLLALAKVETRLSLYEEAEKHFKQAIKIKSLFDGNDKALIDTFKFRRACLEKLNKQNELKKISTLIKKSRHGSWVRKRPGRELSPIQKLQFQLKDARKHAPYGAQVCHALERLCKEYEKEQKWKMAAQLIRERIEIYERSQDVYAGRMHGCTRPPFLRLDYYKFAAKVDSKLKKADASKWLIRARETLPDLSASDMLQLASLAVEIGDKDLAIRFIEKAQGLANLEESYYYRSLSKLWKQLGDKQRASELEKKVAQLRKEANKRYKQQSKSPFADFYP